MQEDEIMNEIENINEIIAKSLVDESTKQEQKQLHDWIEESADNKEYYYSLREICYAAAPPFAPEDIHVDAAEQCFWNNIKESPRIQKKTNFMYYWQRIAAVIVLPLFITIGYLIFEQSNEAPLMQEAQAPFGSQVKLFLSDHSEVWLNSGSKLIYPSRFLSDDREVFLDGEGYFKVKSDKKHPFVVKTRKLNVEAVGTEFNVEAFEADSITSISMMEGLVDVKVGDQSINIRKGERLEVNNLTEETKFVQADTYKWCAWKDGMLLFRDDRLDYILKRISQIYNVDIELCDSTLASHLYRATFKGESLDQILNLLSLSAPIHFDWAYNNQIGDTVSKLKIKIRRTE